MIRPVRTSPLHADFKLLVTQLDKDLAVSDGDEHEFYNQFNGLENIAHAVLLYKEDSPVAIGALKPYNEHTMEIKRMYTSANHRRQQLASKVLGELEQWAHELGFARCILETGKRQPAAIALYKSCGYTVIANYGQYREKENSVCFEKRL